MLKKYATQFFLISIVMAGLAFAQNLPEGKWWKNPDVTQKLNLNEKQINQLDDLFTHSSRNFMDMRSRVETEQHKLKMLLEGKALDEDAIMNQLAKLEKERFALNEERVRVLIKMRQIIGYDAFNSMREAAEKMARERTPQHLNGPNANSDQFHH